jgi:rSAM/selenodomain-associated transferase 1
MQNSDDRCIVFFIKDPSAGAKTRLAARIGGAVASKLYKCFVFDLLETLNELAIPFELAFHPPDAAELQNVFGKSYHYVPQQGADVGRRMKNAFESVFKKGYTRAVLIGSDIPDLPSQFMADAFIALDTNDVVIGPAADGGYYLIGFTRAGFVRQIFEEIAWSTGSAFQQTIDILKKHTNKIFVLPKWYDVDTIDDIKPLLERNKTTEFRKGKTFSFLSQINLRELGYV